MGASVAFEPLAPFRRHSFEYFRLVAVPLLIGLAIGGVMDYAVPKTYVARYLAGSSPATVMRSVGLGFLMSACSHGILALSMELHRKGASVPAVISFLLASPWANLALSILLVGLFGWKGLLIVALSVAVALVTGLVFQRLERLGWIEPNPHAVPDEPSFSVASDLAARLRAYRPSLGGLARDTRGVLKGMRELADMVVWWVLVGLLAASALAAYVPQGILARYLGPTVLGLAATLALATVLEVCSEGSSPLAFEMYRQTGALGNSFAFLMGGVITDYTEIGLVWMNVGKRAALWMLLVTLPQVVVIALLLNRWL